MFNSHYHEDFNTVFNIKKPNENASNLEKYRTGIEWPGVNLTEDNLDKVADFNICYNMLGYQILEEGKGDTANYSC